VRVNHNGFGRRDRTGILEDPFRALALCSVCGMDGDQNLTAVHFIVVLQCLKFRHLQADDRPYYPSHYCATAGACEGGDDGSCSNQRSEPGNRQCSNARQPTEGGPEGYPATATDRGAFRRFSMLCCS